MLGIFPLLSMIFRIDQKVLDPEIEETFLREMIHKDKTISKYFNVETTHCMDYDCEYVKGFPEKGFPEFDNKLYRFFNVDTNMT